MYSIQLDDSDLAVLSSALGEMPYRIVAGLISKIAAQVSTAKQGSGAPHGGVMEKEAQRQAQSGSAGDE